MKVPEAEVARVIRSAAERGEEADFVSARNGYETTEVSHTPIIDYVPVDTYLESIECLCLLHDVNG